MRGLTYLPATQTEAFLDLQDDPSIAEVAAALTPTLFYKGEAFNAVPITWLQASFTARADTTFLLGPIRTRRALEEVSVRPASFQYSTLMQYLHLRFPTRYINSPAEVPAQNQATNPVLAQTLFTPPLPLGTPSTRPSRPTLRTPIRGSAFTPTHTIPHGTTREPAPVLPPVAPIPGTAPPLDIADIVVAAVLAATQGITTAMTTAPRPVPPTTTTTTSMLDLKKLHLRFVCGVTTDADIPPIWAEVQAATTK